MLHTYDLIGCFTSPYSLILFCRHPLTLTHSHTLTHISFFFLCITSDSFVAARGRERRSDRSFARLDWAFWRATEALCWKPCGAAGAFLEEYRNYQCLAIGIRIWWSQPLITPLSDSRIFTLISFQSLSFLGMLDYDPNDESETNKAMTAMASRSIHPIYLASSLSIFMHACKCT